MKNKFSNIFFLLFCITMHYSVCQNPVAIAENAIWITRYQYGVPPYYNLSYTYFRTGGDTLINSVTYVKLYNAPVWLTGPDIYNQLGPLTYGYAFRNDTNNRAYIIPANDSIEHLWYDFNLAVGDTLPHNPAWYSCSSVNLLPLDTVVVASIDSVFYCNAFHKRYKFDPFSFPYLVRDIGFTGDLIIENWPYFEALVDLLFFSPDTAMINCSVVITGMQNPGRITPDILIYPNPATEKINVDIPDTEIVPEKIVIREITGRLLRIIYNDNRMKKITVDLDLPDGTYFLEMQNDEHSFVRIINVIAQ